MGLDAGLGPGTEHVREILSGHGSQSITAPCRGSGLRAGLRFWCRPNRTNFCTMGAVVDIVTFGDWRRMRMGACYRRSHGRYWVLVAVAIDTGKTIYTAPQVRWLSCLPGPAVRLRHDAVVRLRKQDADPGRGRQPEVAGRDAGAGHIGVHDAEGLFAVGGSRARPVALRRRGMGAATSDLPTLAALSARRWRRSSRCRSYWRRRWRCSCSGPGIPRVARVGGGQHRNRPRDRGRLVRLRARGLRRRGSPRHWRKILRDQFRPHGIVHFRGALRLYARTADALERRIADRDFRRGQRVRMLAGSAAYALASRTFAGKASGRWKTSPTTRSVRS